ncbi:hypothetical protein OBBRIDRAFT_637099 [Obba rivulosa]|uniref:Uncharacterized protein n=1 Tax=Obba rivulosa TaxID=1052685 RepID=A0A8E2AX12_9APHY|nr:hypothetical protein OBBRIDRAFT_637099 [Obba rivulosa]
MYAISGRNWWLASAVGLLNMTPVGVNAYINFAAVWYEIGYIPILGESCISGYNISNTTNIALSVSIGTRGSVITADILILVVTWIKTYLTYRNAARNNIKTPVLALLLKDGAIYFMMLLSLNIITIVGELTNAFLHYHHSFPP